MLLAVDQSKSNQNLLPIEQNQHSRRENHIRWVNGICFCFCNRNDFIAQQITLITRLSTQWISLINTNRTTLAFASISEYTATLVCPSETNHLPSPLQARATRIAFHLTTIGNQKMFFVYLHRHSFFHFSYKVA